MIILDFGSGNTCKNDWPYAKRMIQSLADIDRDRKCIIKWQLFETAGDNIPLDKSLFHIAYDYAKGFGFQTTASVFDKQSLDFLLKFDIPFVKIPNRRDLDWLIGEVPRKRKIIISIGSKLEWITSRINRISTDQPFDEILCCVSKYPASALDYENIFIDVVLKKGISDHTADWTLYNKYKPQIYECHFCLYDSTGLDSGLFARRPEQLKEIL